MVLFGEVSPNKSSNLFLLFGKLIWEPQWTLKSFKIRALSFQAQSFISS